MAKKQNFLMAYFTPFGLRQVCDILLIIASIVLIIGLIVPPPAVSIIAFSLFLIASGLTIFRLARILARRISSKSSEHRNALINIVIMIIVFCVSLFGLIFYAVYSV